MRKKYVEKTCRNCGKKFKSFVTNSFIIVCSDKCEKELINKIKTNKIVDLQIKNCKVCNNEFVCSKFSQRNWCSLKCKRMNLKEKICKECGKKFIDNEKRNFCSNDCQGAFIAKKRLLNKKSKNLEKYKEIRKRKLPRNEEKQWRGKTKNNCYYERELDVEYGVLVVCQYCGRKYYISKCSYDENKNYYCCHKCYTNSKIEWKTKICLNCGKIFEVNAKDTFSQFCSDECNDDFNKRINKNKLPALINLMQNECINCGKIYFNVTNNSVLYCSLKCKNEFYKKEKLKEKICVECGKKFLTYHDGKFCSENCVGTFNARRTGFGKTIRPNQGGMNGKKRTLTSREKQSKTVMKKIANGELIPNSDSIQGYYKGIPHYVRSTWEINFAFILLYLKRDYRYESKTFKIKDGSRYLPDFYDVRRNFFYEIKGSWRGDSQEKMEKFLQEYPNVKVHLIDRDKYIRIYQFFAKKIKLVESFHNYKLDNGLNLITRGELEKLKITKEEFNLIHKNNVYKKWSKEFDLKIKGEINVVLKR